MNLEQSDFLHPKSGGLTDAQREYLFYIKYRRPKFCGEADLYVEKIGFSTYGILHGIYVKNHKFGKDLFKCSEDGVTLTETGHAVVDALEAGGW